MLSSKLQHILFCSSFWGASLVAQTVKNTPAMWETWVWPQVGKIPWRRERLPTPVFWPGEFYGQRSLAGSSPCVGMSWTWLSDFDFFRMILSHFDQCTWTCLKWIRKSDSFSNDLCNGSEVFYWLVTVATFKTTFSVFVSLSLSLSLWIEHVCTS